MGPIGMQEMIFIFVLALLLFGPKKLPELGRLVGKGLSEFKKAKNELKTTFESHMQELERETRLTESSKTPASYTSPAANGQYSSASYPYPYDEYGRDGGYGSESGASHENASGATSAAALPAPEPPPVASVESGELHNGDLRAGHDRSAPVQPVAGTVPRSASGLPPDSSNTAVEENHSA